MLSCFFFFNDTATTEIYTLSLHDALPIWQVFKSTPKRAGSEIGAPRCQSSRGQCQEALSVGRSLQCPCRRSEEHTSELQSLAYLVCRLLLEKKKQLDSLSCDLTVLLGAQT